MEGIGKFQYCTSVISYYILFASLGIGTYAIREGAKYKGDRNKYSKLVKELFVINMITTALAYLVLGICFYAGAYEGKENIMLVYSLSIIATTLCIDWLYQSLELYVYISIRTVAIQLIALVMMFLLVKKEEDIVVYTLISVFSSKGYCLLNLLNARHYIDLKTKGALELKKHLRPILVIFGATISVSVYMNMDVIMLGMLCGDYQVGIYSAAVKVNSVVKNIITSISVVFLPRLVTYLANGEKEKYNHLFKQGANLNMFLSVASAVGLAVLSKPIILLFSGSKYLPAVFPGRILAIRLVFSALDNIFYNQILIPNGHEKEACMGTAAGAVSNLVLNTFLIPIFQVEGAAIATVLSEGVVFAYFIFSTKKVIDLKMVLSDIFIFLYAAVIMGIILAFGMFIITDTILQIIILVPLGMLIYISVIWYRKKKIIKDWCKHEST